MTLRTRAPRARTRWSVLGSGLAVLMLTAAGAAFASLPSRYDGTGGVTTDVDGQNDVPGQVDITQMGRDTSDATKHRIFFSWDSISSWTGSGQTGDACALFDSDADNNINFVACARVANVVPSLEPNVRLVTQATGKPVYLFNCSDKRMDRCSNPSPVRDYTGVIAGALGGSLSANPTANLVSETDPFETGESHPFDTSVEMEFPIGIAPGATLDNVCSYPSAGNGGNNNPFDCVVAPGVEYGTLVVNKTLVQDNGLTDGIDSFSFSVNGGSAVAFEADGSNSFRVPVGPYTVTETADADYTTSYANSANGNANCTSLQVTAGGTVTCTITNDDKAGTLVVTKTLTQDSGLTDAVTVFGFTVSGPSSRTLTYFEADGSNSYTVNPGTYTVTEDTTLATAGGTVASDYTTSYSNCENVTVAPGATVTCTITNDDKLADPTAAYADEWTIKAKATFGVRAGLTAATVTFQWYSDSSCTNADGGTDVKTATLAADQTSFTIRSTARDITVAGTYYWTATLSSTTRYNATTSSCQAITVQ